MHADSALSEPIMSGREPATRDDFSLCLGRYEVCVGRRPTWPLLDPGKDTCSEFAGLSS